MLFDRIARRGKELDQSEHLPKFLPSRSLMSCELITFMLAHEEHAEVIELSHLLGGMYIGSFEKLSKYWKDADQFEELVVSECRLEEARVFYWIRAYEGLQSRRRGSFVGQFKKHSPQVSRVYEDALKLATSRDEHQPGSLPVLTPEDLLMALTRCTDIELARKLTQTNIDTVRLEEAVSMRLGLKTRRITR